MTEGKLYYNADNQRYGLLKDGEQVSDGLHCGMTLEVLIDGQWQPTRIECGDDWYLVGFPDVALDNLKARIEE